MGIRNSDLRPQPKGDNVAVPILREMSREELTRLYSNFPGAETGVDHFRELLKRPRNLMEALEAELPPNLVASLPRSFDIVGDVAVVELPPELQSHERLVGEAIISVQPRIRTVLAKAGPVKGESRVREYHRMAGSGPAETLHREHGGVFKVDLSKAYFSPRLSGEHIAVASQVQEDETVVDMFAGVGPFSILIARRLNRVKVFSIDLNPEAIGYLSENIRMNRVQSKVIPILGDIRLIVRQQLKGEADHVIMNLPERAKDFIDVGCEALKTSGGRFHYYTFAQGLDCLEAARQELENGIRSSGRKLVAITRVKTVRPTAPREWQVVVDAEIR